MIQEVGMGEPRGVGSDNSFESLQKNLETYATIKKDNAGHLYKLQEGNLIPKTRGELLAAKVKAFFSSTYRTQETKAVEDSLKKAFEENFGKSLEKVNVFSLKEDSADYKALLAAANCFPELVNQSINILINKHADGKQAEAKVKQDLIQRVESALAKAPNSGAQIKQAVFGKKDLGEFSKDELEKKVAFVEERVKVENLLSEERELFPSDHTKDTKLNGRDTDALKTIASDLEKKIAARKELYGKQNSLESEANQLGLQSLKKQMFEDKEPKDFDNAELRRRQRLFSNEIQAEKSLKEIEDVFGKSGALKTSIQEIVKEQESTTDTIKKNLGELEKQWQDIHARVDALDKFVDEEEGFSLADLRNNMKSLAFDLKDIETRLGLLETRVQGRIAEAKEKTGLIALVKSNEETSFFSFTMKSEPETMSLEELRAKGTSLQEAQKVTLEQLTAITAKAKKEAEEEFANALVSSKQAKADEVTSKRSNPSGPSAGQNIDRPDSLTENQPEGPPPSSPEKAGAQGPVPSLVQPAAVASEPRPVAPAPKQPGDRLAHLQDLEEQYKVRYERDDLQYEQFCSQNDEYIIDQSGLNQEAVARLGGKKEVLKALQASEEEFNKTYLADFVYQLSTQEWGLPDDLATYSRLIQTISGNAQDGIMKAGIFGLRTKETFSSTKNFGEKGEICKSLNAIKEKLTVNMNEESVTKSYMERPPPLVDDLLKLVMGGDFGYETLVQGIARSFAPIRKAREAATQMTEVRIGILEDALSKPPAT